MGPSLHGVTDIHLHAQQFDKSKPSTVATMRREFPEFDAVVSKLKDPRNLLDVMDKSGIGRACLINYPAPEVLGLLPDMNAYVANYAQADPKRLLPFGSVHPLYTKDPTREVERMASRLELRGLKIHPPHQLFAANAYVDDKLPQLRKIYAAAEKVRIPVMVHTGTSLFPGARSKFGNPMDLDDVAQDFPDLKIIMAHGGRPLWCDVAFYLLRRHPNLYLDISGIPPSRLLEWFPRLSLISDRVLFGSDWPGPGVPSIAQNLEALRALPIPAEDQEKMFVSNAKRLVP